MRHALWAIALLPTTLLAATDMACFQDCLSDGYGRKQCVSLCDRGSATAPGLIQQPGAPRNPYFDALPDPMPRSATPLPPPLPRYDARCLDDCRARGYQPALCRRQCSY